MTELNSLLDRLVKDPASATVTEVLHLLQVTGDDQKVLFRKADMVRNSYMGKGIYLRGLIHHSTHCRHNCDFCPQRKTNAFAKRYRMMPGEIANVAHQAMHFGCTTVVLHSGEDTDFTCGHLCEVTDRIKLFPNLSVGVAIGVRKPSEFKYLKDYGVDKFMLRFETSEQKLYSQMVADETWEDRVGNLLIARQNGLQISSGFLIGWPHQDLGLIAQDIIFATSFSLDEIWCDPFISQKNTPMACKPLLEDRDIYFRTIAILRLMNRNAHILSSPAFNAVKRHGSNHALAVGANVLIISMTPERYECPDLYSDCMSEKEKMAGHGQELLAKMLKLGRTVARDPGPSFRSAWVKSHPDDFE